MILFRPTVSPIIYKQQIGRALTAGGDNVPLILDVVNNVEGLYSIDSIGQEMLDAAFRLRSEGQEGLIVREKFRVIDQVKDCRRLFEQLEGSLHIEWDEYYQAAIQYREEHGDLLIPQRYVTEDGCRLGQWLSNLRTRYRELRDEDKTGAMLEQIQRLESIGMEWNTHETRWDMYFAAAERYYREHGDLLVPRGGSDGGRAQAGGVGG